MGKTHLNTLGSFRLTSESWSSSDSTSGAGISCIIFDWQLQKIKIKYMSGQKNVCGLQITWGPFPPLCNFSPRFSVFSLMVGLCFFSFVTEEAHCEFVGFWRSVTLYCSCAEMILKINQPVVIDQEHAYELETDSKQYLGKFISSKA